MNDLMELISKVNAGELDVKDLTLEQAEEVLEGYRQVGEFFSSQESTRELGEAILEAVALADDPFESAIDEAESRGSTYWELETNSIH